MSESVIENTITGFYSLFSTTLKVLCPQKAHDSLTPYPIPYAPFYKVQEQPAVVEDIVSVFSHLCLF